MCIRPPSTPVARGQHTPRDEGWYFYFDFLECAVAIDVPDAPETRTDIGMATDLDTDHA